MTQTGIETSDTVVESTYTPTVGVRGRAALRWWNRHCDPEREGVDRATAARLRRARNSLDALRVSAAVELLDALGMVRKGSVDPRTISVGLNLARLLAHVREHSKAHPMSAAGWKQFPGGKKETEFPSDERPKLSNIRFNRLLQVGDGEELLLAFKRLVALLDGKVNVAKLSEDFLDWMDPIRGDRVREDWAFRYLAAHSATPPTPTDDDTELQS